MQRLLVVFLVWFPMAALEEAIAERSPYIALRLAVDPRMSALRDDPRVRAILDDID
jgi:hypothetical protein